MDRSEDSPVEKALRHWAATGLTLAVLLTGFMGLMSWRTAKKAAENADRVAHTHAVETTLAATLQHTIDVETGARGFAAVGEESFLQLYQQGQQANRQDLDAMRQLIADNTQRRRLDLLESEIAARIEVSKEMVGERRRTGTVPRKGLFLEGQSRMRVVRNTVAEMQAAEDRLLEQRTKRTEAARRLQNFVTAASTAVGIILLLFAGLAIGREISKSAHIRGQLQALNADLEQRVAQRTAALGESEGRLAGVIQSAMDSIITVDDEQRIVLFNAAAERMFRCPEAQALGQSIERFIPQRFRAAHSGHIQRFGETGITNRAMGELGALWAMRADGEEFQIEASISQMEAAGKKMFTVILRDVSERKQAEGKVAKQAEELSRQAEELMRSQQALETQRRMLQSVLDSIAEGLVAADAHGKFVLWNPAAEKILGRGPTDLPPEQWSKHYSAYLPDGVTPFPQDQLPLVRALRGETADSEMLIRRADHEEAVWIEVSGRPLRDENGTVRGGVVAFRDVTQAKTAKQEIHKLHDELEQRVQQRTAELEASNKELETFTYSVSHDLRAPLRHISGFSKILSEEYGAQVPAEAQRYLQRIQEGTLRMGVLVDDLLNLARVGRQELRRQVTGLNSVVREVVKDLQPDCEGRQVEWKIGSLPFVECDPGLMKQVFQNLLSNALKYSRPRSPAVIEVGTKADTGQTVVFVRDNGVGFSMKYADKLFGVFQRLHRGEDFEGTGVGLATVQRVIHKHGGKVWPEAELDKGATFYFTIGAAENGGLKTKAAKAGEPS